MSDISLRIKKLIDKANSTDSIEEADSLMVKAHSLLKEYNLSIKDIESIDHNDGITEIIIQTNQKWECFLSGVICRNNFCSGIIINDYKEYAIIGKTQNAKLVSWMINFYREIIMRMSIKRYDEFLKKKAKEIGTETAFNNISSRLRSKIQKEFLDGYFSGCIKGIDEKLSLITKKEIEDIGESKFLILTGSKDVEKFIESKYKNTRNAKLKSKSNDGYSIGKYDGFSIDINKPIEKTSIKFLTNNQT